MSTNNQSFVPMKCTNKKAQIGDIFVTQPYENIFIYGKVIDYCFMWSLNDIPFVVLSRNITKGITGKISIHVSDLLCEPFIVSQYGFKKVIIWLLDTV